VSEDLAACHCRQTSPHPSIMNNTSRGECDSKFRGVDFVGYFYLGLPSQKSVVWRLPVAKSLCRVDTGDKW